MNAQHESLPLPGIADIEAAASRIAGVVRRTPLLAGTPLDEVVRGRLLFKAECLQRTGSFKLRGAYNRLVQLDAARRRAGVVAFSSGNHAQGVAAAAKMLGIAATIVMPADAPAIKLANTRALGAEVVLYDRFTEDREAIARRLVDERGATLVPAYDDPHVVAGQGTAGLELMQQAAELGLTPDQVLVPTSGGGLTAGTAIAVRALAPGTAVIGVEPEAFDDTRRSLAAGTLLRNPPEARSICDALQSSPPGTLTFAINRQLLAGVLTVSDAEVETAMARAFRDLKLVVEPGGAVALAAALAAKVPLAGRTTAIVLSGGNVDSATFAAALAR
ncbi:MAG TPA: threonine/serine dehydratase [Steroidobacteraceae bacterium]|nr:threonine/serine dehydratase [Steroidobacteraceae bacterium]